MKMKKSYTKKLTRINSYIVGCKYERLEREQRFREELIVT